MHEFIFLSSLFGSLDFSLRGTFLPLRSKHLLKITLNTNDHRLWFEVIVKMFTE